MIGSVFSAMHDDFDIWPARIGSGMGAHPNDPRVIASRESIKRFGFQAAVKLQRLLSGKQPVAV